MLKEKILKEFHNSFICQILREKKVFWIAYPHLKSSIKRWNLLAAIIGGDVDLSKEGIKENCQPKRTFRKSNGFRSNLWR